MTDHIDPSILSFLTDVKLNNNKPWFDANRKRFEAARNSFISFVEGMIANVQAADANIGRKTLPSASTA